MASSSSYNSPCAACKFLRRKCMPGCTFAPYFPPEDPQKFVNVHKLFGASNVTKLLKEVEAHQREDMVNSLAYEAEARVRDPVYGCVGVILILQRHIDCLQKDLDAANADLIRYARNMPAVTPRFSSMIQPRQKAAMDQFYYEKRINGGNGYGGGFYQTTPVPSFGNHRQWINNCHNNFNSREGMSSSDGHGGAGAGAGVGGGGHF